MVRPTQGLRWCIRRQVEATRRRNKICRSDYLSTAASGFRRRRDSKPNKPSDRRCHRGQSISRRWNRDHELSVAACRSEAANFRKFRYRWSPVSVPVDNAWPLVRSRRQNRELHSWVNNSRPRCLNAVLPRPRKVWRIYEDGNSDLVLSIGTGIEQKLTSPMASNVRNLLWERKSPRLY